MKRRFRNHKNSGHQLPSQNSRASGAADPNSRKPMLAAEARDMKVVSSSGQVLASVPQQVLVRGSTFNFLFVRAHASALLVETNQPRKVNEAPTHKEVLAKLRFNKHKNSGDQLPWQNSCTVGGTVDPNSRGLMLVGVNAQGGLSTSSTGMSVLVLGLFHF